MGFWLYILRCADGSYYTGHTDDLERRVAQHQSGALPGYTHDRRPVELMFSESFPTREEALAAELRVKPWSRAKKEALIRADWNALRVAALPPRERAERMPVVVAAPRLRSGRTEAGKDARHPHPFAPSEVEGPPPPSALAPPPVIVLVRPQLGENIGKAARAMLNFGLTELRLVLPRDGWPNPDAGPAAAGADVVLEQARVFPGVADAIADCGHVFATTVRRRGLVKPVKTPEGAARAIHAETARSAILFGAERSGLEADDVALARTIVTVPINPAFGSLNLAQAVILCAYEWSKHVALAQPPAIDLDPPADQIELDRLVAHLDAMLERSGYYFPPEHAATSRRTLRAALTKPGWSAQEVRTMRGVLSALERPRER